MPDLQQLELALGIAAKTIATINTEMVDCPRDLSTQSWPCVQQGCQLEQRTTCWKNFFLEQAVILEQVIRAKEEA